MLLLCFLSWPVGKSRCVLGSKRTDAFTFLQTANYGNSKILVWCSSKASQTLRYRTADVSLAAARFLEYL